MKKKKKRREVRKRESEKRRKEKKERKVNIEGKSELMYIGNGKLGSNMNLWQHDVYFKHLLNIEEV